MNVIYFIGAGGSAPFGIPTMQKMVQLFEEEIQTEPFYDFFSIIKSSFQKDKFDLEGLLFVLNEIIDEHFKENPFYRLLEKKSYFKDTLENIQTSLLQYARVLKSNVIDFIKRKLDITGKEQQIKNLYTPVFRTIEPSWIFTTNYDLVLETYFTSINEDFNYGSKKIGLINVFDISTYAPIRLQSSNRKKSIMKLHGSINLFKDNQGRIIFSNVGEKIPKDKEFMIFPAMKKIFDRTEYFDMLTILRELLIILDYGICIVIGYSFGDHLINLLFLGSMRQNKNFIIFLIDPIASIIKRQFLAQLRDNDDFDELANRFFTIDRFFNEDFLKDSMKILDNVKNIQIVDNIQQAAKNISDCLSRENIEDDVLFIEFLINALADFFRQYHFKYKIILRKDVEDQFLKAYEKIHNYLKRGVKIKPDFLKDFRELIGNLSKIYNKKIQDYYQMRRKEKKYQTE